MKKFLLIICLLFACSAQAIECSSDVNHPALLESLTTGLGSITVAQDEVNYIEIKAVCNQDYGPNCVFKIYSLSSLNWLSWDTETIFPFAIITLPNWTDCYGEPRDSNSTGMMRRRKIAPVYGVTAVGNYTDLIVFDSNGFTIPSYGLYTIHVVPRKEMIVPVGFSE